MKPFTITTHNLSYDDIQKKDESIRRFYRDWALYAENYKAANECINKKGWTELYDAPFSGEHEKITYAKALEYRDWGWTYDASKLKYSPPQVKRELFGTTWQDSEKFRTLDGLGTREWAESWFKTYNPLLTKVNELRDTDRVKHDQLCTILENLNNVFGYNFHQSHRIVKLARTYYDMQQDYINLPKELVAESKVASSNLKQLEKDLTALAKKIAAGHNVDIAESQALQQEYEENWLATELCLQDFYNQFASAVRPQSGKVSFGSWNPDTDRNTEATYVRFANSLTKELYDHFKSSCFTQGIPKSFQQRGESLHAAKKEARALYDLIERIAKDDYNKNPIPESTHESIVDHRAALQLELGSLKQALKDLAPGNGQTIQALLTNMLLTEAKDKLLEEASIQMLELSEQLLSQIEQLAPKNSAFIDAAKQKLAQSTEQLANTITTSTSIAKLEQIRETLSKVGVNIQEKGAALYSNYQAELTVAKAAQDSSMGLAERLQSLLPLRSQKMTELETAVIDNVLSEKAGMFYQLTHAQTPAGEEKSAHQDLSVAQRSKLTS